MSELEHRYRRLLRWYPPQWRAMNGEILLGTALDAAEAESRTHPNASEARSMRLNGVGERFTLHAALFAALGALVVATVALGIQLFGAEAVAQWAGGWLPLDLSTLGATTLLTITTLALLRHERLISPARVVPILLIAIAAWSMAFLASWSWSVGFDEADAGGARTYFSVAFGPLFLLGWLLGGIAVALSIRELTRQLPTGARWAVTATGAVMTPPILGIGAVYPISTLFVGLAFVVVTTVILRRAEPGANRVTIPVPLRPLPEAMRRRVGIFAAVSLVLGLLSTAFALCGALVVPPLDSTRAMQLGLSAGEISAIPLLFAGGWILAARRPRIAGLVWSGVLLMTAGLTIHTMQTLQGSTSSGGVPWLALLPISMGISVAAFAVLRVRTSLRVCLAVVIGAALLIPLWTLLVGVALFTPLAAAVLTAWDFRSPSTARPHPAMPRPLNP